MTTNQALSARQNAGRLNQLKRKGLSDEGRQTLRDAAIQNRPWTHSTGPRTVAGKARVAMNGKVRQSGELSAREVLAATADDRALVQEMAKLRRSLAAVSRPAS